MIYSFLFCMIYSFEKDFINLFDYQGAGAGSGSLTTVGLLYATTSAITRSPLLRPQIMIIVCDVISSSVPASVPRWQGNGRNDYRVIPPLHK
jgi:hypothetical protein